MICLDNLSSEDLIVLTNAFAITLVKDRSADEINVLGNFIVGIGCLMLTIAAQEQFLESLREKSQQNNQQQNNQTINKKSDK